MWASIHARSRCTGGCPSTSTTQNSPPSVSAGVGGRGGGGGGGGAALAAAPSPPSVAAAVGGRCGGGGAACGAAPLTGGVRSPIRVRLAMWQRLASLEGLSAHAARK